MADLGLSPYEAFAEGLDLATQAIALDSTLAEGYAVRGYIMTKALGPSERIAEDFAKALHYGPNSADTRGWYAHFLHREGEHASGLAQAERAITLDPIAPGRRVGFTLDAIAAGRYDRAAEEAEHALTLEPGLASARRLSAISALLDGDAQRCLRSGAPRAVLALCLHTLGEVTEAQAIADSIRAAYGSGPAGGKSELAYALRARDLACYHAWAGDVDEATTWVERAYASSPTGVDFRFLLSGLFERVMTDSGFRAALAEVHGEVWRRTDSRRDGVSDVGGP
jgi:tetratricopeptide (TPR) repeat protein